MKKNVLLSLVLISFISCGNNNDSKRKGPVPDSSNPTVELEPLPENSPEVSLIDDEEGTLHASVPAQKKYNPTVFEDGWIFIPKPVTMILPKTLSVIEGRPGNHLTYVILDIKDGVSLKCIYLGQGNNTANEYNSTAKPFKFDFCVEKSVAVTPGTRATLKDSSENILSADERASTEISLERKDKITVHVNNTNRNSSANITGKVQALFSLRY